MRIVYLHQYFNTPEMAGSTRSFEMARRLVERGHHVSMVTSWREAARHGGWVCTEEAGIKVHWLPVPYSNAMTYGERIRAFGHFAWRAARKAASLPADVILATSTPLTIALPGAYAANRQQVPMVFEVRDLWPEVPIALGALRNPLAIRAARQLERFAYARSRRVVALAPGMGEAVAAAGYPRERITVIPNGADIELFGSGDAERARAANRWLGGRRIVLYAGTLGYVNGPEYFPRLAAACREHEDLCFVMIGDGREYARTRGEAQRLGVLDENFYLTGRKAKRELVDWFAAADLTVSLIRDDPVLWRNAVTNKFFDALAAGTPIACNHPGWQTEVAEAAGAGLRLPPDPGAAAAPLLAFLGDSAGCARAAEAARSLAREQFSRDLLARQLEAVLQDAVARQSG